MTLRIFTLMRDLEHESSEDLTMKDSGWTRDMNLYKLKNTRYRNDVTKCGFHN